MIVSHKHKFIFLKTKKTAGTSIEIALSKFCGPEDIITPVSPEDEVLRTERGYPGPQNYLADKKEYGFIDWVKYFLKGKKKHRYYHHITAKEAKAHLGDEIWDSYYKFCYSRNPWDGAISLYYWKSKNKPNADLSKFLKSKKLLILKDKGYDLYCIDGKLAVDKVLRFENLKQELQSTLEHLGIDEELEELPRAKSKYRIDKKHYSELLSESEKNRISELFAEEIALMDYQYEKRDA